MRFPSAPLAGALALTLCSGLAASNTFIYYNFANTLRDAGAAAAAQPASRSPDTAGGHKAGLLTAPSSLQRRRHTVVLRDAPLASYDGSLAGYPALPRNGSAVHRVRVAVDSQPAQAYLALLAQRQQAFLAGASAALGRSLTADVMLRHAINALVLDLSDAEARLLRGRGEVLFVEGEKQLELLTDRGPAFIGAASIWDGSATAGLATQGEGIVAAVLDTGINWQSPAFAAIGPVDGHVHVNPLGAGNYLGLCGATPPNADLGRCNDKLIGMYNFAADSPTRSAADDNGHGSHVAGTLAGNHWDAGFGGGNFRISGVAPHANLIAYKVCAPGCSASAITQAADQAVADGIVDVMNVSISGGGWPWTEANAFAFLGAHDAGIFIAAAAGNNGPAAGTADHQEPWVQTVAAATHDRVLGFRLDATGPGMPPADTQDLPLRPGALPVQPADFHNVPIIQSPGFADGSSDGCAAFAAGTFTRPYAPTAEQIFADGFDPTVTPPPAAAIAVLNLDQDNSSCGSTQRQANALAAGAVGVIFVDASYINLGAAGNVWSMLRTHWERIAALDPAQVTVSLTRPARAYPGSSDVIADFSARGPRAQQNGQWLVKPDIAAPGVDILAPWQANSTATPNPGETALQNGTSMASPHIAGAAALLRALHPLWTPTQLKSALMLTARTDGLRRQNGQPGDLWDRGAGRVDLTAAARTGLVLDESGANFLAADPAAGGDLAALNLPSLASADCIGTCTFTRTLRRTQPGAQTYTVSVQGFPPGVVTAAPASFVIGASGQRALSISAQSQLLAEDTWSLGEVVLTPASPAEPTLRLPVALKPHGPVIAASPAALAASSDFSDTKALTLRNDGGPTLNWSLLTSGSVTVTPLDTSAGSSGQQAGYYNGSQRGHYWAQPFDITAQTRVTLLRANGYTLPALMLTSANTPAVTFSVYTNAAGLPAGAPGLGAAPLWTYTNSIGTASGISTAGSNLQLDLAAANVASNPLNLPAGRYWLMVWPTVNGQGDAGSGGDLLWAWRSGTAPQPGPRPQLYAPWDDPANWQSDEATRALSAFVQGTVDCTRPGWASYGTSSGMIGAAGAATTAVTFDTAGLAAGTYKATLCIENNSTNAPVLPVPLTLVVPNGGPVPPNVAKSFSPPAVASGIPSAVTITLANPSAVAATLTAALTDALPDGLVVAPAPFASTTCSGGTLTAIAGAASITLGSGAQIPAYGSCTVSADVVAAQPGSYANTIPAGAVVTDRGSNIVPASATLSVTALPPVCATGSVVEIAATAGTTRPIGYTRLRFGFDAVNAGVHQGVVDISICGNVTEDFPAVLNASGSGAAAYTALTIKPAGGAARLINGLDFVGVPMIDLNGADNVTIDGLRSGGNALTLGNAVARDVPGTSTVRFIDGATHNTITRTAVLGAARGRYDVASGVILFSTSSVAGGNSNNTISDCEIGPFNLPSKGVMSLGSPAPNANSGNVIANNNIHDFFNANDGAIGISIGANSTGWTISDNRIYQTTARGLASGVRYAGIYLSAPDGAFTVTGNRIGFGAADGTGTTQTSGSGHFLRAIEVDAASETALTTISDNVIGGIQQSMTNVLSDPFTGIYTRSGLTAITNNRIGSLDGSATITFSAANFGGVVRGIHNTSTAAANVSGNQIGAITIQGNGQVGFTGIDVRIPAQQTATIVGNTLANISSAQASYYGTYGIYTTTPAVLMTDNVVRDFSAASSFNDTVLSGISASPVTADQPSTIARNVVHSLHNAVSGPNPLAGRVYGMDLAFGAQANLVERNLVHSLSAGTTTSDYQLFGLALRGGSAATAQVTVRNNMVRLGLNAGGTGLSTPYYIAGIRDGGEAGGLAGNYYHNSVYIGGSGVGGGGSNTYSFESSTTATRNFHNNIFWNARSNAAGGGTHVALRIAGSTPNPAGAGSDYNLLFASGSGGVLGYYNDTHVTTLANWRALTGLDLNSLAGNPQFLGANGNAVTGDLHINPEAASPVEGAGLAIPAVTEDFDGQPRAGLTPTDIGADAGNFSP